MPKDKQIKLDPMEWNDAMKNLPSPGKDGSFNKMKKKDPAKKAPAKKGR